MAEKTQNIYQKLNNFRTSVEAIRKDKKGYNYKYADINEVLKVITEPLSEVGLIDVDTTYKDENGQLWLETKLINVDNPEEFLKIETPLLMKNPNDPQALGSALTYCRRYNRVTLLGLEQEDDDGKAAAGKTQQNQTKQTYPKPKQVQQKVQQSTQSQPDLKTLKTQIMGLIAKKGIVGNEAILDFVNFLANKGYDIKTNMQHIYHLLKNQNLLDEYVDEYLSSKLQEAGI